ncbi:hypothetical protein J4E82_007987 [Alternaria postmessia]|uniref:uncharacterized protein n=1 Tax=Alternaria postmessia TaxID=1187938 RepID=UPI002224ED65|nr:uncharacterized protein J4E82_007987 [Alternaria postmessia]KAI5373343.1 hypothetical protein J4E82_007987 [Alternaria postmessia]
MSQHRRAFHVYRLENNITHNDTARRFEQIRARWETIRLAEGEAAAMVGWREKPAAHQAVNGEPHENGATKFRRKLSYGFAFISNPLLQRKTIPARQQVSVPLSTATEPSASDITTEDSICGPPLSPVLPFTPPKLSSGVSEQPVTVPLSRTLPMSTDVDVTPKPLPRSRTLSFIPLPVRSEPSSFVADVEGAVKSHSIAAMPRPEPNSAPSKIPTPSPPSVERRRSNSRLHIHQHASYRASQQIKHIATAHALAAANNRSPVRHSYQVRSRTTPNLAKDSNLSQPARFMAPRRSGPKRTANAPIAQKPVLQENIPTDRRITHRRSQIQERTLKRESLAVPGTLNNRRSFGPGPLLLQSREPSFATPLPVRKRMSSQFAQQTPVTVKRIQPQEETKIHTPSSPQVSEVAVNQPRDIGYSGLTPEKTELIDPVMPRPHTDRDLQRKTLGTPNGLGGVWRSSRALALTTHEVSKLPRSYTFHNLGARREVAPPVPQILEQYRTVSFPNLIQPVRMDQKDTNRSHQDYILSDTNSCESIPEETEDEKNTTPAYSPYYPGGGLVASVESSGSSGEISAFPSVTTTAPETARSTSGSSSSRPWSVLEEGTLEVADIEKVKDYMPPLYWAGRFQARYDKWRTDAMDAELNTDYQPDGLLGQCKLNQEKLAACYILGQLRDLCTSDQAADSLWDFEYKYRKDNKLLGNSLDIPSMSLRKQKDSATSAGTGTGPFGRAIRKLTPRKASLVNLMKGKRWNKSDEAKSDDVAERNQETESECS